MGKKKEDTNTCPTIINKLTNKFRESDGVERAEKTDQTRLSIKHKLQIHVCVYKERKRERVRERQKYICKY